MKYYTGIGSRSTPAHILMRMEKFASILARRDWILRSGGAPGADSAFERGAVQKEIYLPWKGFNGNQSKLFEISDEAMKAASEFHPRFHLLKNSIRNIMARNVYQVLGDDLQTPSQFLICWTKNGNEVGGTAQAMRVAKHYGIPIYNLALESNTKSLINRIENEK